MKVSCLICVFYTIALFSFFCIIVFSNLYKSNMSLFIMIATIMIMIVRVTPLVIDILLRRIANTSVQTRIIRVLLMIVIGGCKLINIIIHLHIYLS